MNKEIKCPHCKSKKTILHDDGTVYCYECQCNDVLGYALTFHPHSTYMEFAEWYKSQGYDFSKHDVIINGQLITIHDLFQYWITNVKNKG